MLPCCHVFLLSLIDSLRHSLEYDLFSSRAERGMPRRISLPLIIDSREAYRARARLVVEHKQRALLCILTEIPMPTYNDLVHEHMRAWDLSGDEVHYVHDLFYEYIMDYHFAMHCQELCILGWLIEPRRMQPGEQALGARWICQLLLRHPANILQSLLQQHILRLQCAHLVVKELEVRARRVLLYRSLHPNVHAGRAANPLNSN